MVKLKALVTSVALMLGVGVSAFAQNTPDVSFPINVGISPPMRDVVVPPQAEHKGAPPVNLIPRLARVPQFDPALQNASGVPLAATAGTSFDGIAVGAPGCNCAPPDTNMAVGPNDIVQWVNTAWAVYDKAGNIRPGFPKAGNSFWAGFGGDCQTHNDGDPIMQYDAVADRWMATQFAINAPFGPYSQCIAVSQTSDPAGAYFLYQYSFSADPNDLNDYPKFTVWPVSYTGAPRGAYFASYNMFQFANFWAGPKACAYDRDKMLTGAAAAQVCFQQSTAVGSILPTDLDGKTVPAAGTPNFYFDFGTNELLMWKFTPNFATPGNSTFTGPTHLAVASFTQACGGCVAQSETTQTLDTLSDRLMYRNAYRAFSDHNAVFISHSVDNGSGGVAPRWYEIRDPNGAPTVFQQGTFAPDSTYRWMSSIASDQAGNVGLGYSASSSTMHPAIRFSGRETGDPLGTLQTESTIFQGLGSQLTNLNRWGDYAALRIDPADDCTFWFTTEYIPANGTFNWHTRIGSFKFNSCGAPPPLPPLPPTALTATAVAYNRVDLSWLDASNNESGFKIDRCTGLLCTNFAQIATVAANVQAYSDTSVAASTDYTYQVKAFNAGGDSLPSNPATATTPAAPPVPAAPTNLTATASGSSTINLAWSDNSLDEDGFKIERCAGVGCSNFAQIATTGANVASYSDNGLSPNTSYSYRVRAFNANGNSGYSNTASAITDDVPPAAPSGLTANASNKPSTPFIDLAWTDNSNNETSFTVERCAGSGCSNFAPIATPAANTTTYRDSGVLRRTTYSYRVKAANAKGSSAYSNTATATTK